MAPKSLAMVSASAAGLAVIDSPGLPFLKKLPWTRIPEEPEVLDEMNNPKVLFLPNTNI
jgi:hypothetical protein